jgi:hypothetical protein
MVAVVFIFFDAHKLVIYTAASFPIVAVPSFLFRTNSFQNIRVEELNQCT